MRGLVGDEVAPGRPLRRSSDQAGRLDQSLDRLFLRTRPYYLHLILWAAVFWVLMIVVPCYTALLYPNLGEISADRLFRVFMAFELAMALAGPGVILYPLRRLSPALRWLRSEPGSEPVAAWNNLALEVPRIIAWVTAWLGLWCIAPTVYTSNVIIPMRWYGTVLYVVLIEVLVAAAGFFAYLVLEVAVRAPLRVIALELPRAHRAPLDGLSLGRKLLAALLVMNLFTGLIASLTSPSSGSLEGTMATILATVACVTATLALGFALLIRAPLLERLHDLRNAMGRLERRDYDVHLVPIAGDELDAVSTSFNTMVDRLRQHDQDLQESRARIVAASDEARRRVERDLHDGAQQHLVTTRLRMGMAQQAIGVDPQRAAELLDEAAADLARALEELRDLAHGIYPAILVTDGVGAALETMAERFPMSMTVVVDQTTERRYGSEEEAAVYFSCLEALQNAAKHAGDGVTVTVRLAQRNGALEFEVVDDGLGYDPTTIGEASGLLNLADRIGALGGTLHSDSTPGAGTTVRGRLPLSEPSGSQLRAEAHNGVSA